MLALAAAWLGGATLAQAEETTLLFGTSTPRGTHISVRVFHPWAERINAQGKGIVKIDPRDGMEIANPGNFYSRVRDDVIQIGWGSHNSVAGTFPLSGFSNMPFQTESSETSSVAFWRLIKAGYFDAEYKWQAAVAPVTDAWIKATPGGDKILAAFRETLVKVKAGQ
jgi:TRAP-type C4-dicarboxylate transport system substrate-binding protein